MSRGNIVRTKGLRTARQLHITPKLSSIALSVLISHVDLDFEILVKGTYDHTQTVASDQVKSTLWRISIMYVIRIMLVITTLYKIGQYTSNCTLLEETHADPRVKMSANPIFCVMGT